MICRAFLDKWHYPFQHLQRLRRPWRDGLALFDRVNCFEYVIAKRHCCHAHIEFFSYFVWVAVIRYLILDSIRLVLNHGRPESKPPRIGLLTHIHCFHRHSTRHC